jgi:hypothetical protein
VSLVIAIPEWPEDPSRRLGVDVLREQQTRVGMAKIVQSHSTEAGATAQGAEVAAGVVEAH